MAEATQLVDHFSLGFISGRVKAFRPPDESFDPGGDWTLNYGVYTFASGRSGASSGAQVGRMQFARKAVDDATALLTISYDKLWPEVTQHVEAEIRCGTDRLSTPGAWHYSARVADYENSKITKRATANDGRIEICDDHSTRRLALNGHFTINWALWDAVMRLPREAVELITFTMLDHFDQIKRRQSIAFRKSVVVSLGEQRRQEETMRELPRGRITETRWATHGGRNVTLHAFEHLGEGIVPWVYWLDDHGRLLFVISGIEVYILESLNG